MPAKTQKAKGIMALYNMGNEWEFGTPKPQLIQKSSDIPVGSEVRRFTRACPLTPCHGFVESRITYSAEEVHEVFKEARAADPQAELILMPPIEAEASAIWTPGQITLGPGHDGATSGRGVVTMEVTGELVNHELLQEAGVTEVPYLEFVHGKVIGEGHARTWVVQLRSGPPVPAGVKDFIPEPFTVQNVISIPELVEDRPTLLDWMQMVKSFPPGTAVYHPGGGLADHYSVHCIQLYAFGKILVPLLTTHKPKVGETLEKCTPESPSPDTEEMQRGFKLALSSRISNESRRYLLSGWAMLAGVHNAGVWMGRNDRLIGYGMGMAFRLCHTACMGELRHKFAKQVCGTPHKTGRDEVYGRFFDKTLLAKDKLLQSIQMFYNPNVEWGSNFGGPKWGDFAWLGVRLYNAVVGGRYQAAVEVYNELVNAVHNNGWAFNKFLSPTEMDRAAKAGAYPVLQALPLYLGLLANPKRFRLPSWSGMSEPMRVENRELRSPVRVQVTLSEGQLFCQIGWSRGKRTPRHPIPASDAASKLVKQLIEEGIYVYSMSKGSDTEYVALTNKGNWLWYVEDEPVVVVEPQKYAVTTEIIWPDGKTVNWGEEEVEKVEVVPVPPPKLKKKVTSAEPPAIDMCVCGHSLVHCHTGEPNHWCYGTGGWSMKAMKEYSKGNKLYCQCTGFKPAPPSSPKLTIEDIHVGDWVKCLDQSHPGKENPFQVTKIKEAIGHEGKGLVYSKETQGETLPFHKQYGKWHGCSILSVIKVPPPDINPATQSEPWFSPSPTGFGSKKG